jgi:hypothetical protein
MYVIEVFAKNYSNNYEVSNLPQLMVSQAALAKSPRNLSNRSVFHYVMTMTQEANPFPKRLFEHDYASFLCLIT